MKSDEKKVAFGLVTVAVAGHWWVALEARWRGDMSPWRPHSVRFSLGRLSSCTGTDRDEWVNSGMGFYRKAAGKNMGTKKMEINNGWMSE